MRHGTSALVVDDDAHLRALMAELLEEEGYDVATASNGFSGLRLALERHPRVILLDLVLPELSGLEILRELRGIPTSRGIGVVVVSAHTELLKDVEATGLAIDHVLAKPFDVGVLLASVRDAASRPARRRVEVPPVGPPSHREPSQRALRSSKTHQTRRRS